MKNLLTYRRTDGDTDIIFLCNQADTEAADTLRFDFGNRSVEIWDPYTCDRFSADNSGVLPLRLELFGSRFVVVRPGESALPSSVEMAVGATYPLEGSWSIDFPEIGTVKTDSLFSWHTSDNPDFRQTGRTV